MQDACIARYCGAFVQDHVRRHLDISVRFSPFCALQEETAPICYCGAPREQHIPLQRRNAVESPQPPPGAIPHPNSYNPDLPYLPPFSPASTTSVPSAVPLNIATNPFASSGVPRAAGLNGKKPKPKKRSSAQIAVESRRQESAGRMNTRRDGHIPEPNAINLPPVPPLDFTPVAGPSIKTPCVADDSPTRINIFFFPMKVGQSHIFHIVFI